MIDLDQPVFQTIETHPELLDILVDLGFKPLANPKMLNSVGKITSLRSGCKLIRLDIKKLIQTLYNNGYQVKGVEDHD